MKSYFKRILTLTIIGVSLSACSSSKAPNIMPLPPIANSQPVNIIWQAQVGGENKNPVVFTPALSNDQLFTVNASGKVTVLSAISGQKIWQTQLPSTAAAGVGISDKAIYIPTSDGKLYALNRENGQQLWQMNLPNQASSAPVYNQNQIFINTIDSKLVAIDTKGQILWSYDEGSNQTLQLLGNSQPVLSSNHVIAGFPDGQLNAIDRNNGTLIWQSLIAIPDGISDLNNIVGIYANLILSQNIIYVVSYQGSLTALDKQSGKVIWQKDLSDYAGLAHYQNKIIAVTADGKIVAFNSASGEKVWLQSALTGRLLTAPIAANHAIVVGDNQGNIYWLNPQTGNFIARIESNKTSPIMVLVPYKNQVIALFRNGKIIRLKVGT